MTLADPQTRFMFHRMGSLAAASREKAWAATPDADALKARAIQARDRVLQDLPGHLARLEQAVRAQGITVVRANNAQEANRRIVSRLRELHAADALRNHHPLLDEIRVDEAARINNIRLTPLLLGDFLARLTDTHSGHPVWPIGHLTVERISEALRQHWRVPETYDPDRLASLVRMRLRRMLLRADVAVMGVNFAVVEDGLFVFLDNDGHNPSLLSLARHVILVLSIDQMVADLEDLQALMRVFALSAWGRPLPAYIAHLQQAAPPGVDGPQTLYLIIVDNRRSEIIAQGFGQALRCIHCGACHTTCPVYQQIGGEGYAHSPYTGPIGTVINPLLLKPELGAQQTFLCDAAGLCASACPLDIDFHGLRQAFRRRRAGQTRAGEDQRFIALWRYLIHAPRLFRPFWRRVTRHPNRSQPR